MIARTRPARWPVLCHAVLVSQVTVAEPWTPASIVGGAVLLVVVVALIVWAIARKL